MSQYITDVDLRGQASVASRALTAATVCGSWVLLQNCHLGLEYMEAMEDYLQVCRVQDRASKSAHSMRTGSNNSQCAGRAKRKGVMSSKVHSEKFQQFHTRISLLLLHHLNEVKLRRN